MENRKHSCCGARDRGPLFSDILKCKSESDKTLVMIIDGPKSHPSIRQNRSLDQLIVEHDLRDLLDHARVYHWKSPPNSQHKRNRLTGDRHF